MNEVARRWWQLPLNTSISTELREQARLAAAGASIARNNLRDSCKACAAFADIARDIVAQLR